MTWHVQLRGTGPGSQPIPFPFGRGCSFYQVNEKGQIVYGRDIVEPSSKPGSAALQLLSAVTPLVRAIGPQAADPLAARPLPMWLAYAGYWWFVMASPHAPGDPVYATSPETIETVYHVRALQIAQGRVLHVSVPVPPADVSQLLLRQPVPQLGRHPHGR